MLLILDQPEADGTEAFGADHPRLSVELEFQFIAGKLLFDERVGAGAFK